jgi:hypothetical protein
VVEQDIGVLEEPGGQNKGQRDAHQAGLGGKGKKHCENDQNTGGSAAGGAQEEGEEGEVRVIHSIIERFKCSISPYGPLGLVKHPFFIVYSYQKLKIDYR